MASNAEQELRDAVVARLRKLLPTARIIHELNVAGTGSSRIDVAAVMKESIVAVELKSEKDKLDRLADQWAAFSACSHHVVIALHRIFYTEHRAAYRRADLPATLIIDHPLYHQARFRDALWCYPVPDLRLDHEYQDHQWLIDPRARLKRPQPHAAALLDMLWREELAAECVRHGIANNCRSTRSAMIRDMAWMMTGREICHATCRQLRGREFALADPPIVEPEPALGAM